MTDFTVLLPQEILRSILTHLNQNDCLESMCVSHRWYSLIPDIMKEAWNNVEISSETYPKANDRLLHCLGLYGNKLHINEMNTYDILKVLESRACSFTSIDIVRHRASSVESERYSTFMLLLPFSDTLRELTLLNQSTTVSPLQLLGHLPALTHLTLLFDRDLDKRSSSIRQDINIKNVISNVAFLYLDGGFLYERKIITVLQYCPYLKALVVANGYDEQQVPFTDTEFRAIMKLCPQLRFVKWDSSRYASVVDPNTEDIQRWKELSMVTESYSEVGVRELDIIGHLNEAQAALPLLMQSRQTLENLKLYNMDGSPSFDGLKDIELPQLKHIQIHGVSMDLSDWKRLFCNCHEDMESVSLTYCLWAGDDTMDSLVTILGSLKHLRSLTLGITYLDYLISNPGTCDSLGSLSLNTHLYSLSISDIGISGRALLDLCYIRSLRELSISIPRTNFGYGLQTYEVVAFAETLVTMDSNIRSLSLSAVDNVTDVVLEHLGRVKSLLTLSISYSQELTEKGVNLFLHGKEKNPGLRRTLRLKACPNAILFMEGLQTPWYGEEFYPTTHEFFSW